MNENTQQLHLLGTCSKFSEQEAQEGKMDKLQAGVEPALAVLPWPAVLLQPRKAALNHPTLGHDLEGVQFAALGKLYCYVLT